MERLKKKKIPNILKYYESKKVGKMNSLLSGLISILYFTMYHILAY